MLDDEIRASIDDIREVYGGDVTLRQADGDELDVEAVAIGPAIGEDKDDARGIPESRRSRPVTLKLADITSATGWREIDIDGETWSIEPPAQFDGYGLVTLRAVRTKSRERSALNRK